VPYVRRTTALLSPFDRLVRDRVRTEQLFGFAKAMTAAVRAEIEGLAA
jgi:uncharacterized protein YcaQ